MEQDSGYLELILSFVPGSNGDICAKLRCSHLSLVVLSPLKTLETFLFLCAFPRNQYISL